MAKKIRKKSTASQGIRPSVGIIMTLAVALIISIVINGVFIAQLKTNESNLTSEKVAIFDHLAESYIRDMDFTVNE